MVLVLPSCVRLHMILIPSELSTATSALSLLYTLGGGLAQCRARLPTTLADPKILHLRRNFGHLLRRHRPPSV
eukprot:COSAG06_NODE_943_length_11375_cov_11.840635_4_plen_73_part_00